MKTKIESRGHLARMLCLMGLVLSTAPGETLRAHEHVHTHASLSVGALLFLDQVCPEDGALFSSGARERIRGGSVKEDDTPNYINHFYDPIRESNTTPDLGKPQTTAPRRAAMFWPQAVRLFRSGNADDRLAAFETIGYVCHLLQDMTSPAHVHNDVHAEVPIPLELNPCQDGDDFENWGWSNCPGHVLNNIQQYISSTNLNATMGVNLTDGLKSIFKNQPQQVSYGGVSNIAYSFVRELALKVYDFTTFNVTLRDTRAITDNGGGELETMFPSLRETTVPAAWWIESIGYSQGQCSGPASTFPQAWWMMSCTTEDYCGPAVDPKGHYCVVGKAYIENTGGGGGAGFDIPDDVYPRAYNRDWYSKRYGRNMNAGTNNAVTMLRIYGDVLYPAAVAYGAGLLQAFLDEAIMPRPITMAALLQDGSRVRLNGLADPGGTNAAAWFEWGTDQAYGTFTQPQELGSGTNWLALHATLQGLAPDTTYHCRVVSSNRFGIRHGTNQVFRTPPYTLAAQGLNAWQITDHSSDSGSTLYYSTNLGGAQQGLATSNGWKLTFHSRLAGPGTAETMHAGYGQGNRRFLLWFSLDANGDLTVRPEGLSAQRVTNSRVGATGYHTHEIQYANGNATYRFDGTLLVSNWAGSLVDVPGRIFWGAGSSAGRGQMNVHRVEFTIGGASSSALYDAGLAGDPAEAPDPAGQGWTRNAGGVPITEGPLSPDGEPFLAEVETWPVSGLGVQGAQLNGRIHPQGSPALTWFEWGLNGGYGNITPPQVITSAQGWTDVSAQLGALAPDLTYHYRLVASNRFGIRLATNSSFLTPGYLVTGVSPNAWQITDNSPDATHNYRTNLGPVELAAATNNGWRYAVTCRMTPSFQGPKTMTFYYALGGSRFLIWWDLDDAGNLTAELEGRLPRIVAATGAGATNYHIHELVYDPATRRAAYWFDGTFVTNWPGASSGSPAGQVAWGAGSSDGMAQMNFHKAEFAITGFGTVALYDAATSGQSAVAPNPTTRGWSLSAGTGPASGPLAPDPISFLPIANAETLAATAVGPNTAQLNASVNSRGQSTAVWFEWGTTAAYGNRTLAQSAGQPGNQSVAQALAGLGVDTTYQYRIVASNAFAVSYGSGQTFHTRWFKDSAVSVAAIDVGSVAWGDYDNDGYLDLIITGQADTNQVTELYRNQGGTNLVAVNSGLPRVNQSAVAWGDYDRDGYLDLALSGWHSSGAISRVYRNLRNGTFADLNAGLPGLRWSCIAWCDYDNDGDLDLLLAGLDDATTHGITRLYRNDGGTNFVESGVNLPGVHFGSVAWADFDGDGDSDFVLTGRTDSQIPISRLYRNEGGGYFSDTAAPLPGVEAGSVAWGDYDRDGDPDLLLTGWDGGSYITHLFRNDRTGAGTMWVDVATDLPGLSSGSVAWGDYDNDGDLDILMAGWVGDYSARLFRNDAGIFVEGGAGLTGVNWASAAWADFDKDGDLDALVTGSTANARVGRLYRNEGTAPNAPPSAPTGLTGSGIGNTASVSWNPAVDTTPDSLSYNLTLRAATNGVDLAAPMSEAVTGFRRVTGPGNAGGNLSWSFTGLKPGTYYFTVQAIDSSFAGGPFAPWQTLQVAPTPVAIVGTQVLAPGQFRLQILAEEGGGYEVLRSIDLSTWQALGTAVEVSPGLLEFVDAHSPGQGAFYRVRSTAP